MPNEHSNEIIFAIQKLSSDNLDYIWACLPECLVYIAQQDIKKYKSNILSLIK
jgi:hypothetical protein